MKNNTFFDSIKCAFNGLYLAFKTEKNFKYYLLIAIFFLIINLITKATIIEFLAYTICTFGVFSAECLNTGIENLANSITQDVRPDIKLIKDISATSVLMWGFAFFIVEGFIIIPKFL